MRCFVMFVTAVCFLFLLNSNLLCQSLMRPKMLHKYEFILKQIPKKLCSVYFLKCLIVLCVSFLVSWCSVTRNVPVVPQWKNEPCESWTLIYILDLVWSLTTSSVSLLYWVSLLNFLYCKRFKPKSHIISRWSQEIIKGWSMTVRVSVVLRRAVVVMTLTDALTT